MNNSKIERLIDKIAEGTKENNIKWDRTMNISSFTLDNNTMLEIYIKAIHNNFDKTYKLREDNSYYAKYKGGLIFLVCFSGIEYDMHKLVLSLQGNKNAKVSPVHEDGKYQSELIRLQYLIEEKISKQSNYIDEILGE